MSPAGGGGESDFELSIGDDERLFDRLDKTHEALGGAGVRHTPAALTDATEPGRLPDADPGGLNEASRESFAGI